MNSNETKLQMIRIEAMGILEDTLRRLQAAEIGDDFAVTESWSRPLVTEKRRQRMIAELQENMQMLADLPAAQIPPSLLQDGPAFHDELSA